MTPKLCACYFSLARPDSRPRVLGVTAPSLCFIFFFSFPVPSKAVLVFCEHQPPPLTQKSARAQYPRRSATTRLVAPLVNEVRPRSPQMHTKDTPSPIIHSFGKRRRKKKKKQKQTRIWRDACGVVGLRLKRGGEFPKGREGGREGGEAPRPRSVLAYTQRACAPHTVPDDTHLFLFYPSLTRPSPLIFSPPAGCAPRRERSREKKKGKKNSASPALRLREF